ncbi:hypothetical protein RUM44_011102 [Polyplax serrata]|uniref:Uncharacterized protein n=1 Tax=Polyplax serrata TaxID=468196 RepID=A0ABR1AP22_POLSC
MSPKLGFFRCHPTPLGFIDFNRTPTGECTKDLNQLAGFHLEYLELMQIQTLHKSEIQTMNDNQTRAKNEDQPLRQKKEEEEDEEEQQDVTLTSVLSMENCANLFRFEFTPEVIQTYNITS